MSETMLRMTQSASDPALTMASMLRTRVRGASDGELADGAAACAGTTGRGGHRGRCSAGRAEGRVLVIACAAGGTDVHGASFRTGSDFPILRPRPIGATRVPRHPCYAQPPAAGARAPCRRRGREPRRAPSRAGATAGRGRPPPSRATTSSNGTSQRTPESASCAAEKAAATPIAFLSPGRGTSTRPPTGSHTSPSRLEIARDAAQSACSGVPPRSSTSAAAGHRRRRAHLGLAAALGAGHARVGLDEPAHGGGAPERRGHVPLGRARGVGHGEHASRHHAGRARRVGAATITPIAAERSSTAIARATASVCTAPMSAGGPAGGPGVHEARLAADEAAERAGGASRWAPSSPPA